MDKARIFFHSIEEIITKKTQVFQLQQRLKWKLKTDVVSHKNPLNEYFTESIAWPFYLSIILRNLSKESKK
ncbi:conserved hypothetical protein [Vibrio crassostreae]|nr:conserved hypothetical protein [Vibrio crassostreae]CAK1746251.1 conserved hypothetical protein [Vibrio crassostreae]CAK1747601.1 conserved hypothetical protein [Vibrio crassostreae]CAK1767647.1 conserved hypothetical protein [Vibrio crassostreae]CAK1786826.1 conserved hypothetical protein [Vibrio crassostreae]